MNGTRLVLALLARHPVAIVARRLKVGVSTVYGWARGVTPSIAHRLELERVFAVPYSAWGTPPANSAGDLQTKGSRFSSQIGPKSKNVTGGAGHGA